MTNPIYTQKPEISKPNETTGPWILLGEAAAKVIEDLKRKREAANDR